MIKVRIFDFGFLGGKKNHQIVAGWLAVYSFAIIGLRKIIIVFPRRRTPRNEMNSVTVQQIGCKK